MGRVLKRVPLDFDAPIGKIWVGYLQEPEFEPPAGDGYQLWENTTEGSPISPVFKTTEELAEYCEPNCPIFGTDRFIPKGQWLKMFKENRIYYQIGDMIFI